MDVPPIRNACLMNLGDLMMRWSNGMIPPPDRPLPTPLFPFLCDKVHAVVTDTLKSTIHRVGIPPLQDRITGQDRMTRERYSIPYFVSPEGDTVVKALGPCVSEARPEKYAPIRWNDYMLMRASMQYT